MRKISEILCCVAILCCALSACSDKPATVKVSSFNIWLNTLGGKLPPSQTAKVIEASQTDIVGIQEGHIYEEDGIKHDHVPEIADALKGVDIPVLVKNPVNPDLELWIGALERINNAGLKRLGAIHRGFSSYDKKMPTMMAAARPSLTTGFRRCSSVSPGM